MGAPMLPEAPTMATVWMGILVVGGWWVLVLVLVLMLIFVGVGVGVGCWRLVLKM